MPKLSVIIPIYNRTELFKRGLDSIFRQTMPKGDFEILIIDNRSTEDIKKVFEPYIGKMNIRHIKIDPSQHPIYKEMSADEEYKKKFNIKENWYHTPAIAINIGIKQARGEIICITQPEVIHAPVNFIHGYNLSKAEYSTVFGEIVLATDRFNQYLQDTPNWGIKNYPELWQIARDHGKEYEFFEGEYYWYIMFLPKQAAMDIGGVDEEYCRGVYGEDDNFRVRARMAVRNETYRGESHCLHGDSCIRGIHQSHRDEAGKIENQNRESRHWEIGADTNRKRVEEFYRNPQKLANQGRDWGDEKLITEIKDYLC